MNEIDYTCKPSKYYAGARKLFIDDLPYNPEAQLLEIGCGNGDTGAYALQTGKCGWCVGVELCPEPARAAAQKMSEVITGNIEDIELPYNENYFDAVIISEVLEHLRDPWKVLKKIRPLMKLNGLILAGSPNVAHYSVLRMLIRGQWEYTTIGVMDSTHLRWFTPASYKKMFEDCGFKIISIVPAVPLRTKAKWFNRLTMRMFEHALYSQMYLKAQRQ